MRLQKMRDLFGETIIGAALTLKGIPSFRGSGGFLSLTMAAHGVFLVAIAGIPGDLAAITIKMNPSEVALHPWGADGGIPVGADLGGVDLVVVAFTPLAAMIVEVHGALAPLHVIARSLMTGAVAKPIAVWSVAMHVASFGLDERDVDSSQVNAGDPGASNAVAEDGLVEVGDGDRLWQSRARDVRGGRARCDDPQQGHHQDRP